MERDGVSSQSRHWVPLAERIRILTSYRRIAIAVFVHASPADEPTREATIARLARAAYDTFSAPASSTPASPRP